MIASLEGPRYRGEMVYFHTLIYFHKVREAFLFLVFAVLYTGI